MTSYAVKWILASLVMPLVVFLFGKSLNHVMVLVFWPGSIALMSLGAEKRPLIEVVYVWGFAISLNILYYLFVGMVLYLVVKMVQAS